MTNEEIEKKLQELESFWRVSENDAALELSKQLLSDLNEANDTFYIIKIKNILGNLHSDQSDYSTALEYYNEVIRLGEKIEDKKSIAISLGNKAVVYRKMSDYVNSLTFHQQALKIFQEIDYPIGIANNFGNIAIVYRFLSEYEKALDFIEKALLLNTSNDNKYGIANNYTSFGIIFQYLNEHTKAITYYQNALQIYTELESKYGIGISYNNLGLIYSYLHDFSKALEYQLLSLEINESINNRVGISANNLHIGLCYYSFENYEVSLEYYLKSLAIETEVGNKYGVIVTYINLTDSYIKLHQYEKAEESIQTGFNLALENDDKLSLMKLYEKYSKLAHLQQDYKREFLYLKKYIHLKEEIESKEAIEKARIFDQKRVLQEDEKSRQLQLARFQEQERIFHNILPISIANRLIEGETTIAESYENICIFFSDIVGFTELSSTISATDLVNGLNTIFTTFDRIASKYDLEKIKTIGDAYMAVCGIPDSYENNAERTACFAFEIVETIQNLNIGEIFSNLKIRIGIHNGSVIAGIIGERKFSYDVWGESVTIATKLESNSEPNRIHISEQFAKSIESNPEFNLIPRGTITIKGKGTMNTFWLEKAKKW